jgi:hypothetical protein
VRQSLFTCDRYPSRGSSWTPYSLDGNFVKSASGVGHTIALAAVSEWYSGSAADTDPPDGSLGHTKAPPAHTWRGLTVIKEEVGRHRRDRHANSATQSRDRHANSAEQPLRSHSEPRDKPSPSHTAALQHHSSQDRRDTPCAAKRSSKRPCAAPETPVEIHLPNPATGAGNGWKPKF